MRSLFEAPNDDDDIEQGTPSPTDSPKTERNTKARKSLVPGRRWKWRSRRDGRVGVGIEKEDAKPEMKEKKKGRVAQVGWLTASSPKGTRKSKYCQRELPLFLPPDLAPLFCTSVLHLFAPLFCTSF